MGILYLYLLCICMGFLMPPCASVWMDACRYVSIIFLRTLLYGLVQDNQEAKFGYQNAFLNKWEHPIQVVLIRLATPSPPPKKKDGKKGQKSERFLSPLSCQSLMETVLFFSFFFCAVRVNLMIKLSASPLKTTLRCLSVLLPLSLSAYLDFVVCVCLIF